MKIITFNLRHDADRWESRFPMIVDELAAEKADVVALQEVALPIHQARKIRDELARQGIKYHTKVAPKWTRRWLPAFLEKFTRQPEGIGILSRHPIIHYRRIVLSHGSRIAQHIQVEMEDQVINVLNTHLHHKPLYDDAIRLQQMRDILDYIDQVNQRGWIIVGDFNARPESEVLALTASRFQSAFEIAGETEPDFTFPTPLVAHKDFDFPNVRIDYVLCEREQFDVTDARVVFNRSHPHDETLYPSDHFGLAVTLDLR